jgi:hypothetical protein
MRRARRTLSRLHAPTAVLAFLGVLWGAMAFRIEAWPLSSYPMYSMPKDVSQVRFSRFGFELDTGEVLLWKPHFPYVAKDLNALIERSRGEPGFDGRLQRAALAVLRDVRHDPPLDDLSRIRKVVVVDRTVRPVPEGVGWAVEDRLFASFDVEDLR